jgi:hypothetical protein
MLNLPATPEEACTYVNVCNTDDQCDPMDIKQESTSENRLCNLLDEHSFCDNKLVTPTTFGCPRETSALCMTGVRNGEVQRVCNRCDSYTRLANGDCISSECAAPLELSAEGVCQCVAGSVMKLFYDYSNAAEPVVTVECIIKDDSIADNCIAMGSATTNCTGCAKDYSLNLLNGSEGYGTCIAVNQYVQKCQEMEFIHGFPMCK